MPPRTDLMYHVHRMQEGQDDAQAHKRLQQVDLSPLCGPVSLAALAKYIFTCLCDKMHKVHISNFASALKRCLGPAGEVVCADDLHEAVMVMASHVADHLHVIDVAAAQVKACASREIPAAVLSKMVRLHDTYLGAVSTMLQTSVKADLQRVRWRLLPRVQDSIWFIALIASRGVR
jgi:hypothetical protein